MRKDSKIPRPPIGWPLFPVPEEGSIRYPSLEESIRQSIRIILLTRPGEQLMRPEFGAGLDYFLHEPNVLATRCRIREKVMESLNRWESRIILDRVDVWEIENHPEAVRVEIAYRIKRIGSSVSMTFTMKLGS